MSLSLQNIRDGILKATATDITDWTNGNVDLDLYANQSWWDIMDQFDFREKEGTPIVFSTVAGTISYNVGTVVSPQLFDAIQRISIEDPSTFQHSDLDLVSDFDYENEYINLTSVNTKPTQYFRRNNLLYLRPTPDTVYKCTIYYLQILSDLPGGGPVVPQSWHEIIKYGAIWRALRDIQDLKSANDWEQAQIRLINSRTPVKAKELADTKMAGVSVYGRDY